MFNLTNATSVLNLPKIKKLLEEAEIANKLIGTRKIYFENLPAVNLNNYPVYRISNIIDKYIKKIKPEIILIPSGNDIHDDHKIVHKAAKVSMRPNKTSNLKIILSYEVLSETEWNEDGKSFNPNYFVHLKTKDIKKKIKAFLKYKSQVKKFPHPRSKEGISKVKEANYREYAEAFRVEKILS